MSKQVSAQELRVLALREVQRSRVPATDKIELWIPAPQIARLYGTPEVMHAINRETQSQTWDAAMASLCALDVVKNRGIRVTCTNRDLAIKLGGTVVNCMGQKLIVKPYSAYERYYYVDLTHIPDGLDEDVIYDHFSALGLQPIIAPTHVAGSLMSRDRTVWFPETDVPDALFTDGVPLREIYFAGFDYPVYVQHKKRSLNKVLPPTIAKKRAETEAKAAASAPRATRQTREKPTPRVAARVPTPVDSVQQAVAQSDGRNHPSSSDPSLVPTATPDKDLILERPEASAPVLDWVKVSRHASCLTPASPPADATVDVSTKQEPDGRLVFGFPVLPTRFELAFGDHDSDEPTAGDADCVTYVDNKTVSSSPMMLAEPVGQLVVARSILRPKTNAIKRSNYRRHASKAAEELPTLLEPDDRLAALTAQPSAYAALTHACPPSMSPVIDEHALLRVYSGTASESHGKGRNILDRIRHDYPDGEPPAATAILEEQISDAEYRATARAYATMDLFWRTHAPAIYYDPIKVQALCGEVPVSSFQYSNFLLWTDETLHALCVSPLGQAYDQYLSDPVLNAMELVRDNQPDEYGDNVSMASSDQDGESTVAAPADDMMEPTTSSQATHL
ncbi:hypothetical protein P3T76_015600 [Phytophthora citrophthora]|uniref:Uncharacterized protein n=1 Tax=Phytophthora citrophthora TaxID=4793 RepID=A0AAD9FZJ7_9STRA|nr:hypothetical protein P3T76_015600 [Phytophthora citrophthora]